jgi:hypothetical protein
MECVPKGFTAMVPAITILTLAVALKNMIGSLGADLFFESIMTGAAAGLYSMLPAVIFLAACALAFSSGTSWGTFSILIPIVAAIFPAGSDLLIIAMSACLAGAVCGDHCSPISDTTIMASAGAQCEHIIHVETQLPYATLVAVVCAAVYLIAAVLLLVRNRVVRYAIPLAMAAAYGLTLALLGDYTPAGNVAIRFETWILPMNRDGYSWVLTTPMFGVMTLCGMYCTEVLKAEGSALRKVLTLLGLGVALLGGGLVLELWEPAIKRIYTVSFTFQALGWGVLMLTLLYGLIDVCRLSRGWGLLTLFGRRALTAYLCGTLFWYTLNVLAQTLVYGTAHLVGNTLYPLIQTLTATILLTAILWFRDRT